MQKSFLQRYLGEACHEIEGWFPFDAALLFMAYNQLLQKHGPAGHVLEIGVHHGLSTIAVATLLGPGKQLVAIDLFEKQQHLNVSNSGEGSRALLERNLRLFYPDLKFLRVLERDSGTLAPNDLGEGFTFCHIDGGHSRQETYHDLSLCAAVTAEGGLIAVDDYFNPDFPGVCEGAVEFLVKHPGKLHPLAIGYQKILFRKGRQAFDWNGEFLQMFPALPHKDVQMWGDTALLMTAPLRNYVDLYASTPSRLAPLGSAGPRATLKPATRELDAAPQARVPIEVLVTNVSPEPFPAGEDVFGLSYHLHSHTGEMLAHDNDRTWLATELPPGQSQKVEVTVQVPQERGAYELEFDLVWEQVMWFKEIANPTAMVALNVR